MLVIDRCVCYEVSFSELKELAGRVGASCIRELQRERDFGLSCRLCHPYVSRMLETGQVVFHEIIEPEDGEDTDHANQ